ncbi:RHS repeat domain-containing protein [Fontivita pretiosa]|uniref:RHS repeat domain-containing protein n=1 Tax=Fontivita pretiosa TaxID=2989684 RepID=UPI003D16596C
MVSIQPDSHYDDASHSRGHGMRKPLAGMKTELPIIDADTLERRHYALQDANYSLTCIVDTNGDAQERYTYTPYGVRSIMDGSFGARGSSSFDWNIGHQGLMHDEESGLVYNRTRDLSAQLGRFLQRDPAGYVDGLNSYQYLRDAPIDLLDPYGLEVKDCDKISVSGKVTPAIGLPFSVGASFHVDARFAWKVNGQRCQICCPDGSWGRKISISGQVSGYLSASGTFGYGFDQVFHGVEVSAFVGIQLTLKVEGSGGGSAEWTTCDKPDGRINFCVDLSASLTLRGFAEAKIGWWLKYGVGVELAATGSTTGYKICFSCGSGGCSLEDWQQGEWKISGTAKACFWKACYTHEWIWYQS